MNLSRPNSKHRRDRIDRHGHGPGWFCLSLQKRLESLSEAELQALLEQVEEEKQRVPQVPEEPNAITFRKK